MCLLQKSELTANLDMASHFVSRHLVAGDLDSIALKKFGQVTTLQGINATITELQVGAASHPTALIDGESF